MKKILSFILLSLLAVFALTGCGGQTPAKDEKTGEAFRCHYDFPCL